MKLIAAEEYKRESRCEFPAALGQENHSCGDHELRDIFYRFRYFRDGIIGDLPLGCNLRRSLPLVSAC